MKLIIGIVIGILLHKFWAKIVEADKNYEESIRDDIGGKDE